MILQKNLLFFILGLYFISCGSFQTVKHKTEINKKDTPDSVSIDTFYIGKSRTNGKTDYKEYVMDSSKINSPFQIELNNTLKIESIDDYFKEVYLQEKLISADEIKMLSITDSLFTNNSETDLFYFIVFTKSMNGSDGFYSEALGLTTFDFITKKTEWFANYFNIAPKLTDTDMDNWANFIYGEIQISREGEEFKAIKELETLCISNIKEARKEYKPIIEILIKKIKIIHNKSYKP